MKNLKRTVSLAISSILLVSMAAACSGGSSSGSTSAPSSAASSGTSSASSGASGEEYKVYFYAWTNPDNVTTLLDAFNKEYEGKYEMVYQKMADAKTMTINTALASGERIDVMFQASAFDLHQRAESGNYLGLTQFLEKEGTTYKELFGDAIEQTQNFDGEYYSVPYGKNINMVWFNKKMFDEAGVSYPDPNWTWDDFRETAKKLTSGEGANKVYGAAFGYVGEDMYWNSIAQQKLGNFYYYAPDFKSTRFDAPEMKESLRFFYDMVMGDKTVMPLDEYTALQLDADVNGMNGLYSDRYAMWVAPVYGCLYLNESYGDIPEGTDIGLTNFPRPAGASESSTIVYTSTGSIPSNVENPEAAWTALKYICIDHADLYAGSKAMHPGYDFPDEASAKTFNELIFSNHPGLDYDMAMDVMLLPRKMVNRDNPIIQGQGKINDLILADMSLVFNGEMSVDDALADLKTKGDEFITAELK